VREHGRWKEVAGGTRMAGNRGDARVVGARGVRVGSIVRAALAPSTTP
jgi:hypothetical protein